MTLVIPVRGPITQPFGPSKLRVEPTMYANRDAQNDWTRCKPTSYAGARGPFEDFHPGIDIGCPVGTPVRAPADGIVLRTNVYRVFFNGRYVEGLNIYYRFGTRILLVDHLSRFVAKEGQHCIAGQIIARTGNSGSSYGPHAHEEVRIATDVVASRSAFRRNPEQIFG